MPHWMTTSTFIHEGYVCMGNWTQVLMEPWFPRRWTQVSREIFHGSMQIFYINFSSILCNKKFNFLLWNGSKVTQSMKRWKTSCNNFCTLSWSNLVKGLPSPPSSGKLQLLVLLWQWASRNCLMITSFFHPSIKIN